MMPETQLPTPDLEDELYPLSERVEMIEHQVQSRLSENVRIGMGASASTISDYLATESVSLIGPESAPIVVPLPKERSRQEITFCAIQEWEGTVLDICKDTFTAALVDVTAGDSSEKEWVELPVSDLNDIGKSKLRRGALFRYSIGYQLTHGSKRRVSEIVFRDLPRWTRREVASADNNSEQRRNLIVWDVDTSSTK